MCNKIKMCSKKIQIGKKTLFTTYVIYWIEQKVSRFIKYRNVNNGLSFNKPVYGEEDEFCKIEDSIYDQQLHEELTEVM